MEKKVMQKKKSMQTAQQKNLKCLQTQYTCFLAKWAWQGGVFQVNHTNTLYMETTTWKKL